MNQRERKDKLKRTNTWHQGEPYAVFLIFPSSVIPLPSHGHDMYTYMSQRMLPGRSLDKGFKAILIHEDKITR
jgi:hypothetical protein